MTRFLKEHKIETFLFLTAFGIRFLYALFVQIKFGGEGFLAYSDAFSFYLRSAENLINHGVFSLNTDAPYMPDAYRPPLYILLIAGVLWARLPLFLVIFFQNIIAGFTVILIYKMGFLIFDSKKVGLFSALVVSVEPMSIYWNNLLMSDYLYAFLFILSFYLFVLKRYFLFSFIFGLATLTRSVGFYLFPLFLLAMVWRFYSKRKEEMINNNSSSELTYEKIIFPWSHDLKVGAVSIIIFFAILFPWMLRNKIVFNTWELTSASWYNLYGNVTSQYADKKGFILPRPEAPSGYPRKDISNYDFALVPYYKEHFWKIFKENPLEYIKFHSSLVIKSLFKNPYKYLSEYVIRPKFPQIFESYLGNIITLLALIGGFFWYVTYFLSLIGFFDRKIIFWSSLFISILAVNAVSLGALGIGADMSRYMLPLSPFLFMFALKNFYAK